MKAYVCNKCGRVITNEKMMKATTKLTLSTDNLGVYEEMHLCDDCKKRFHKFVHEEREG